MQTKQAETISILTTVLLAVAPLLLWFSLNQAYPDGDNSDYTWQALRIARKFLSDGFLSGIQALYPIRTRKEIIHPLLAVPGLLASGGQVLRGQFITMILIYSMFSISAYALARVYLRRLDSMLATVALAAIPWASERGHNLNAELPFTVFFMASWAAILHSEGFRKKWPAFAAGILTGLSACARPAEAVVLFVPSLAAYFLFLLRSTRTPWKELRNCLFCLALVLFSLGAAWIGIRFEAGSDDSANWKTFWLVIGILAVVWSLYLRFFRTGSASKIQFFSLVAASTALLWFAPVLPNVVNWIISCSYQNGIGMASERVGFGNMWRSVSSAFSGPFTPALLVLAATFSLGSLKRRARPGVPWIMSVLATLAGLSVIHFYMGMRSYNSWSVYYFPEIACLYLAAFALFLRSSAMRFPKRILMAGLILAEFLVFTQAYGITHTHREPNLFHGAPLELPLRIEDPALTFFQRVEPDLAGRIHVRVAIDHRDLGRFPGMLADLEYIQLRLIALEHSHTVEFTIWGPADGPLPSDSDFYLLMVGHAHGPGEDDEASIEKIKNFGPWRLIPVKSTSRPGYVDLVDGTVLWVMRQ